MVPTMALPASRLSPAQRLARKDALVRRLELGWQKIEDAQERGEDVSRWEDAWLRLLGEYEAVCRSAA